MQVSQEDILLGSCLIFNLKGAWEGVGDKINFVNSESFK
jgi:hypothetical protein